jgi:hypothetical protein
MNAGKNDSGRVSLTHRASRRHNGKNGRVRKKSSAFERLVGSNELPHSDPRRPGAGIPICVRIGRSGRWSSDHGDGGYSL